MAVKTYYMPKDAKVFCAPHTQVYEMQSKDGASIVLVDETLMEMNEKLIDKLRCKWYKVVSGYRTPSHSVKVGGSRTDQHTKGKAIDAIYYDANGKVIPAKIVCCVAQDLGFNGIAYINSKEVHLDMGNRAKPYLGDERKGTNSVTRNFYEYFKVTASDVAKYTGDVEYFAKYTGNTVSIVTALKSIGETSSFSYRAKIAKINGITLYTGTAKQNGTMLDLLKQGKLIKP